MILVELLSNTIKYAFPNTQTGTINIELRKTDSQVVLIVQDNGTGLPKDYDISKIKSTGLQLVNLLLLQLDSKINFISDNGLKVIIEIPMQSIL